MTTIDPKVEHALRARFDLALHPQLRRLDRPGGYVSTAGASGAGRASGYLLGVCESIIVRSSSVMGIPSKMPLRPRKPVLRQFRQPAPL